MNELINKQIDHYRIDILLGEGGMAYGVALKVMLTQLAGHHRSPSSHKRHQ